MDATPSRRAGVRRRSERDKGAAIAEFALVVPFLVLLLVGIIEFGAALNHQISIQGGAREGARILALRNSAAAVDTAVRNSSGIATITSIQQTPCPAGTTSASTALATVVVQSEFTFGIPFVDLGTRTITASASMRCGL